MSGSLPGADEPAQMPGGVAPGEAHLPVPPRAAEPSGTGEPEAAADPSGTGEHAALEIELEVDHEDWSADALPPGLPTGEDLRELVEVAAASAGVVDGHVAITIVEPEAIHELNLEHRGKDKPTDVLSFPIDGAGPVAGPREIGDVVICPEHTVSLREAVVHGILHLVGFDHETDDGEMLAVQAQILRWLPGPGAASAPTGDGTPA